MYAQDSLKVALKDSHQIEIKTTDEKIVLADNDSILPQQNELQEHIEATLIDSLWLQEMYSSPLYDSIRYVMNDAELDSVELKELPTALLKERLAIIDSETPFNVELQLQLRAYHKIIP